jgi:hypothetical protein
LLSALIVELSDWLLVRVGSFAEFELPEVKMLVAIKMLMHSLESERYFFIASMSLRVVLISADFRWRSPLSCSNLILRSPLSLVNMAMTRYIFSPTETLTLSFSSIWVLKTCLNCLISC